MYPTFSLGEALVPLALMEFALSLLITGSACKAAVRYSFWESQVLPMLPSLFAETLVFLENGSLHMSFPPIEHPSHA